MNFTVTKLFHGFKTSRKVNDSDILMETSDREIYQAVMDAIDACENINGSDDIELEFPLTLIQFIVICLRQCQPFVDM